MMADCSEIPQGCGQRSQAIWEEEKRFLSTGVTNLVRDLPLAFERGESDVLFDVDGKRYIDWSGGTLTASTGHSNPNVARAIKEQLDRLWNIHDHPSATRAKVLRRLCERMPSSEYALQFYTTGSEAVEAALRAALGVVGIRRRRVASFSEGYHGKTRGSLMVVHALFGCNTQPQHLAPASLPFPRCYRCPYEKERRTCGLHCAHVHAEQLERDPTIGVFIFEPVLGTGGVYGAPDGYWAIVSEACNRLGILLIADEVSTGVFRTGTFLAVEQLGVTPDLVVFGKGIGSGFPTMVLGGRRKILCDPDGFSDQPENQRSPKRAGVTYDFRSPGGSSSTFGGNPLALAAIGATLDEIDRLELHEHVRSVGDILRDGLRRVAQDSPLLGDVRGYGLMLGVELVADPTSKVPLRREALVQLYRDCAAHGLLIKFDEKAILHITPPLTHTTANALAALKIFAESVARLQAREEVRP